MFIIKTTAFFAQTSKKLKKKYPHIKDDLIPLVKKLRQGILEGDRLQGFEGNIYKVRVASSDQKRGKSGDFRIVYYAITEDEEINLIFIFPKASQANLTPDQIKKIKQLIEDLKQTND